MRDTVGDGVGVNVGVLVGMNVGVKAESPPACCWRERISLLPRVARAERRGNFLGDDCVRGTAEMSIWDIERELSGSR